MDHVIKMAYTLSQNMIKSDLYVYMSDTPNPTSDKRNNYIPTQWIKFFFLIQPMELGKCIWDTKQIIKSVRVSIQMK